LALRRIAVRKPFGVISSAGMSCWPPASLKSTSMRPASERRVNERLDLVLLAHIAGLGRAAAWRAQCDRLAQRRVTASAKDDERADSGQLLGDRAAEAAATAREQHNAAVEQTGREHA
jgi:hypothetical protein